MERKRILKRRFTYITFWLSLPLVILALAGSGRPPVARAQTEMQKGLSLIHI